MSDTGRRRLWSVGPAALNVLPRQLGGRREVGLLPVAVVLVLGYLVLAPVAMAILSSFKLTEGVLPFEDAAEWTLQNYRTVFLDAGTYSVLANTLIFSVGSVVLSMGISIVLAWLVERTDMPLRNVTFALVIASIGIPSVISAIAWVLLLNPTNGLVNLFLRGLLPGMEKGPLDIFTMGGLLFVQSTTMVPVTFLLISAAFRAMDASLEDAAFVAGASRLKVMRLVALPLIAPALLGAAIYQFVNVVASFDLPLIIGLRGGIPLLSTEIYTQARPSFGLPNFGVASTYSILLLALAFGPLLIYTRLLGRGDRFATISSRGYRPSVVPLGSWKLPALLFVAAFMVVSIVLPVFVMVWTSVQPFYAVPSPESIDRITFDAYQRMVASDTIVKAMWNTVLVGTATAIGALTLGFLVGWILVRTRSRLRLPLDMLAFIPHALPGVIIGLSVLLLYLLLPLPLYGTIWLIAIGLMTQFIALSTRLMSGGIVQVERQLEEAGDASGASRRTVLGRIVLPLVLPVYLNGVLLVFVASIQHLTIPLMLFTPDSAVLSTVIWREWDHGDTSMTAALGVVMVTATVTLSILLRRLRGTDAT
jgi:iron(III) transport system permease protein